MKFAEIMLQGELPRLRKALQYTWEQKAHLAEREDDILAVSSDPGTPPSLRKRLQDAPRNLQDVSSWPQDAS